MHLLPQSNIHLHSFSFREQLENAVELDVSAVTLENLNLFIGNNAQGKTRILRILRFIKELLTEQRRNISSHFSAEFIFELNDKKRIHYQLSSKEGNNYIETIEKDNSLLLDTGEKKVLVDEETFQPIANFFVPPNIPAISAIQGKQFTTVKLIREFFLRMLFIDANKPNQVFQDPNAVILNASGTNLSSVLFNWEKKYPNIYRETKEDFISCFPFVDDMKFIKVPLPLGLIDLLAINEKGISKEINQTNWSDGVLRTLNIICLPKTQFEFDGILYPPSLICIDEIENGLDFHTLEYITDYLKTYSDSIQILMSSHSPLMGQFVHPRNWLIVKRKGPKIGIAKPSLVEKNLDEQLELYRQEFWDFYTKYVSVSDLYEPE